MRTGHGDEVQPLSRQSEGLGAVDDLLVPPASLGKLRVGLLDRSGDHDGGVFRQVYGVVTQMSRYTQVGQVVKGGTAVGVGARDPGTAGRQQLGDDAHARSPDADEVERPACQCAAGSTVLLGPGLRRAGQG